MGIKLVVVEGFEDYRRGDEITDEEKIKEVLESEYEIKVRKVNNILDTREG